MCNFSENTISVVNALTGAVQSTLTGLSNPVGVAVDPAGVFAYVTNNGNDTVAIIDVATHTITAPAISVGDGPRSIGRFMVAPNHIYADGFE